MSNRRGRRGRRPGVEALEGRELLAGAEVLDFGPQGKVVVLQGTPGADFFMINDTRAAVNGESVLLDPDVVGIYALGGDGDDRFIDFFTGPDILRGDAGDDHFVVRSARGFVPKIVYGGPGDDTFVGDPARTSWIDEDPGLASTDLLGLILAAGNDGSPVNLVVSDGPDGSTLLSDDAGSTILPPEVTTGVFDLGNDDTFVDLSPTFTTITYGGSPEGPIVADDVHPA